MKSVIGFIVLLVIIAVGSVILVEWASTTEEHNATVTCQKLSATPHYTYRTDYICVTPDGRVVGP